MLHISTILGATCLEEYIHFTYALSTYVMSNLFRPFPVFLAELSWQDRDPSQMVAGDMP